MKFLLKYLLLFPLLLSGVSAAAQKNNNEKLALQYFEQKDFDKANTYFEDLYDKSPEMWFPYYYKSLMAVKDYSRAEKLTKKHLKNFKQYAHLNVLLGRIYKLQNDEKKEKASYDKALKDLLPVQSFVQSLANTFIEFQLYDYAIETYNKGKTKDYPFFYERADVYKQKNDLKSMINEYLDALEFRDSDIGMVQSNLQNSLGYDDDEGGIRNPLLKQELQKRIQKHPDRIVFTEFLIFIQKQQKDFDGAFVQTRALDKRLKEEGQRVFDLAKICVSNENWDVAKRCYEYLLEKGPGSAYYDVASVDILNVEYLAVTQKPQATAEELLQLETRLVKAKEKYQNSSLKPMIIKNLASLQAYYLNKTEEAVALLNDLIENGGMDGTAKATFKLMLADILLLKANIWDASLLYSQVEKDFKYEPIGHEAKYKNAKLSFYAGDFKWAKTQADVLKGATTKLIANDALDLSLIITDAIGVDTNDLPLKMFASAELMIVQHRYEHAIARMDSINQLFSSHTLGDDIFFKKASIYQSTGKYEQAAEMYKKVIEFYPTDLYGDDSQFRLAELFEKRLNDNEKAKQAYQDIMTKYPGSIYVVEARKRFRELRGDAISN